MEQTKYPKGSEWRKWDLHLHSPATVLNNQFEGRTPEEKWEKYLGKLEEFNDIAVLGITDYFSINGYLKLKEFKDSGRLRRVSLLLPNTELRILPVTGDAHAINLHFIFSPGIVEKLDSQFFQNLDFRFNGNTYKCTRPDLIRLGRDFKSQPDLADSAAYKEGVEQFKTTPDQLKGLLDKNADLKNNCLIAVANSSHDGNSGIQHSSLSATRQEIYRMADLIFSGNPSDIAYFLGQGPDTQDVIIRRIGALKPCVTGTDAHDLEGIGKPSLSRFTWIKADPTFEGLRQILHEPEARVSIGTLPLSLQRLSDRPTRIVKAIEIRKTQGSTITEKWFDTLVALNTELVAIIGNKGSGKSALSDILGLLGNTPRHGSFSFLKANRFCNPKNNKAKQFQASLTWADGTVEGPHALDKNPESNSVEKIRYIPQNYLEEICNEIGLGKAGKFYAELQQVIFSHVLKPDRLGFETLDQLLEHRSEETNQAIALLIRELQELNQNIVSHEERLSSQYRKTLESQLAEKRRELDAHAQAKPLEVHKPEEDTATQKQSKAIAEFLGQKQAELTAIEKIIQDAEQSNASLAKRHLITWVNSPQLAAALD